MIKVALTTQRQSLLSGLVRWVSRSKASHSGLLIDDPVLGTVFLAAEANGYVFRTLAQVQATDVVVAVFDPGVDLGPALRQVMAEYLDSVYDYVGLLGMAWVLLGRWLRRKWKNPLVNHHAVFCSEVVAMVLQKAGVPGADLLVPADTTPQDLYEFFTVR